MTSMTSVLTNLFYFPRNIRTKSEQTPNPANSFCLELIIIILKKCRNHGKINKNKKTNFKHINLIG